MWQKKNNGPGIIKIGLCSSLYTSEDFANVRTVDRIDGLDLDTITSIMHLVNGDCEKFDGDPKFKERLIYTDFEGIERKKRNPAIIVDDKLVACASNIVRTTFLIDKSTGEIYRLPIHIFYKFLSEWASIAEKTFPRICARYSGKLGTSIMMFATKKVVETGGNTHNKEAGGMAYLLAFLKKNGYDNLVIKQSFISNIVATAKYLYGSIDIKRLSRCYNSGQTPKYIPEDFPAVIIPIFVPSDVPNKKVRVTTLTFESGSIVAAGAKNYRQWAQALSILSRHLYPKKTKIPTAIGTGRGRKKAVNKRKMKTDITDNENPIVRKKRKIEINNQDEIKTTTINT
jgi:TATA-box binding protein (TBP) (component of TFIID and TFIIIB)